MSELQRYNNEAIKRQITLVRGLCRALSRYHGFEDTFKDSAAAIKARALFRLS
jgi:hypothetical protein